MDFISEYHGVSDFAIQDCFFAREDVWGNCVVVEQTDTNVAISIPGKMFSFIQSTLQFSDWP